MKFILDEIKDMSNVIKAVGKNSIEKESILEYLVRNGISDE